MLDAKVSRQILLRVKLPSGYRLAYGSLPGEGTTSTVKLEVKKATVMLMGENSFAL
jgi:hypothetical protein